MLTLMRRVPWWCYGLLVVLLYAAVMEYRVNAAERRATAIEQRIEAAKLDEIGKEREALAKVKAGYEADRVRLRAEADRYKAAGEAIAKRLVRVDEVIAKGRAEGRALVESGTVDQVVEAGARLGYHPVAQPRLR